MGMIDKGIGFVLVFIVLVAVGVPLINDVLVLETENKTETLSSSGSTPDSLQVSTVGQGLVPDSETILFQDSTESTIELQDSDYNQNYSSGEFEVTNADPDNDGVNEIDSTSDSYEIGYKYRPTGYIGGPANTILSLLGVVLVLPVLIQAFRMM